MQTIITKEDIKQNSLFFWFYYFSFFRGFDDKKELNMDDAMQEVVLINEDEFNIWWKSFFASDGKSFRSVGGRLDEELSFEIEFHPSQIDFFINDYYIGNLGGHFEAWSLSLEEISFFQSYEYLFLLLLPMVGITKKQQAKTKKLIIQNLNLIPELKDHSGYIAKCITNGLIMNGEFYFDEEVGIVNTQNHSVRNILKYPRYRENVIKLNQIFKKLNNKELK